MKIIIVVLILRNKKYYPVVTALTRVLTFAFSLVTKQIVKLRLCAVFQILS